MKWILTVVATAILTPMFGQLKVNMSMGYGTYSMKSMKDFQEELRVSFPVRAKTTESFPGYVFYEFGITTVQADRFVIGGYFTYGSTGGRIHYEDYSGEMSSDQLVRYVSIGSPLGIVLGDNLTDSPWRVHLDLKPHFTVGMMELDFYSRIGNQEESDSYKFTAFNLGIEPGLTVERSLAKKWDVTFFAGYNANLLKGNLYFQEENDAYLQNQKGETVTLDFSGFRAALGISYKGF